MKYANSKYKEELDFMVSLIRKAKCVNAPVPEDLVSKIQELYGPPMLKEVPDKLMDYVRRASLNADQYVGGGWNACEGHNDIFIRAEDCFWPVRRVLLQQFYPGREGIEQVRNYWKAQREMMAEQQ